MKDKGCTNTNFISRVEENFGYKKTKFSRSERKILQDAFFRFVENGFVSHVEKWLDNEWADILACDKNGNNALQILCKRAGLPKNRWKSIDFNSESELSSENQILFTILKKHYEIAQKELLLNSFQLYQKQMNVVFDFSTQLIKSNKNILFNYLYWLSCENLYSLKEWLKRPNMKKRQVVYVRRFVRKMIPVISEKRKVR